MTIRRLVGIDLGIASAHTVRILDEIGTTLAKRRAHPTVESLIEVEQAALAGCDDDMVLEVIVEPTGPAWLPIAVFFTSRGHLVFRVSSAKASDLRKFFSRTPRPTASTPRRWLGSRWSIRLGCNRCGCLVSNGRRWIVGSAPVTGSPVPQRSTRCGSRTWSVSCCR